MPGERLWKFTGKVLENRRLTESWNSYGWMEPSKTISFQTPATGRDTTSQSPSPTKLFTVVTSAPQCHGDVPIPPLVLQALVSSGHFCDENTLRSDNAFVLVYKAPEIFMLLYE